MYENTFQTPTTATPGTDSYIHAKSSFLILPRLNYGSQLYRTTNKMVLRFLDSIQSAALCLATGAFRNSPTSSLCAEASIPPLPYRCLKLKIIYLIYFPLCNRKNYGNDIHFREGGNGFSDRMCLLGCQKQLFMEFNLKRPTLQQTLSNQTRYQTTALLQPTIVRRKSFSPG